MDVGTGSGCIALALAHEFRKAEIYATDISEPALAVARANAQRLGMADRVTFLECDLLDCFLDDQAARPKGGESLLNTFDFVVSNPPYVGRDELDSVQREVREFEPRLAWGGLATTEVVILFALGFGVISAYSAPAQQALVTQLVSQEEIPSAVALNSMTYNLARAVGPALAALSVRKLGIPASFADYVKLMFDLQVVAFQADLTRVATMMIGREGSLQAYPEIGVPDSHHPLTHHRGNPEFVEKVTRINAYHLELFAHFIERLEATPDGDGSLLDHALVVYGSAISDGDRHTHEDLPVLLLGRGGGGLKPGRHLVYPRDTPLTNLYLTLLDRMGVRPESIGDSTGKLEHLADL